MPRVSWMPRVSCALAVQLCALPPASLLLLQRWWSPLSRQSWATSKWILLLTLLFFGKPQIQLIEPRGEHGQPCSPRPLPAATSLATEGQDYVDLAMHMLFNFLSLEWLINMRGEIQHHWSTLSSGRTGFAPSLHCSYSLWSQSRGGETFLSSWHVLQRWEDLGVNQSPTATPQTAGGRFQLWGGSHMAHVSGGWTPW